MTAAQPLHCPAEMTDLAQAMAEAVRPIIRRHFRTRIAVNAKDDASPVTVADRQAEQAMRDMIAAAFPSHGIRGEEFGLHQPEAEVVWVLDSTSVSFRALAEVCEPADPPSLSRHQAIWRSGRTCHAAPGHCGLPCPASQRCLRS